MEKYGFVYIWFDVVKRKFYIGSHWGNANDSYKGSSTWFKRSYKRRPNDFKRKILEIVSDRTILRKVEAAWLGLVKDHELGKRYYNLTKSTEHWSTYENNSLKVISKLKNSWNEDRKERQRKVNHEIWNRPGYRENFRKKTIGRQRNSVQIQKMKDRWTNERRLAQAERLRSVNSDRFKNYWLTHKTRKERLIEHRFNIGYIPPNRSEISKNSWKNLKHDEDKLKRVRSNMSKSAKLRPKPTDEIKVKISKSLSKAKLGKSQRTVICPHCKKEGGASTMPRWHFDNCKSKIACKEETLLRERRSHRKEERCDREECPQSSQKFAVQ